MMHTSPLVNAAIYLFLDIFSLFSKDIWPHFEIYHFRISLVFEEGSIVLPFIDQKGRDFSSNDNCSQCCFLFESSGHHLFTITHLISNQAYSRLLLWGSLIKCFFSSTFFFLMGCIWLCVYVDMYVSICLFLQTVQLRNRQKWDQKLWEL